MAPQFRRPNHASSPRARHGAWLFGHLPEIVCGVIGDKGAKPRIKCGATVVQELTRRSLAATGWRRGCWVRLCFPTLRSYGLTCAMMPRFSLACATVPVSKGRVFTPEWKVTIAVPIRQLLGRSCQRAGGGCRSGKLHFAQTLAEQRSPARTRAEGALNPQWSQSFTPCSASTTTQNA